MAARGGRRGWRGLAPPPPPARVRQLRGNKMAMIFQDPLSSLHPFYLISDLQNEFGSAVIMITHDLGVVAELADDVPGNGPGMARQAKE